MTDRYESPFSQRWASEEMLGIFSDDTKFRTWRKLWIALAKGEKALGLNITDEQIAELEANRDDINYADAAEREKAIRHDVMAHVYAYGLQCPNAKGIIHLGATSCYVCDNTDIILVREALLLVKKKLLAVISNLADFAQRYKALPTLGFTHFQPAQLTTVGKRATLWLADFIKDVSEIDYRLSCLKLRGAKGTTGSQASFLELFDGDGKKVAALDADIARAFGFAGTEAVTGQTYSRKIDAQIAATLAGVAASASKFATDMRLLQSMKELEEPFEKSQVGSSAMPYKRNPMRSERVCSLARYVTVTSQNAFQTASVQWLERTLDDSANRRVIIPELFLAVDAILEICANVSGGIVVYDKVIRAHIDNELPFMASENIMMNAVKAGGDRQVLHEKIRECAMEAGKRVKEQGLDNDLLSRIEADPAFGLDREAIDSLMDPSLYIGRCVEQVEEMLENEVKPVLADFDTKGLHLSGLKV
ncbi:MAG: adenylosuccinate lyase [Clostridia bacterium]|nr:adenylosuccinate lyase [Clostridia bacterium]